MKKLLKTLTASVAALALAFGIAAPALAANLGGGAIPIDLSSPSDFALTLDSSTDTTATITATFGNQNGDGLGTPWDVSVAYTLSDGTSGTINGVTPGNTTTASVTGVVSGLAPATTYTITSLVATLTNNTNGGFLAIPSDPDYFVFNVDTTGFSFATAATPKPIERTAGYPAILNVAATAAAGVLVLAAALVVAKKRA